MKTDQVIKDSTALLKKALQQTEPRDIAKTLLKVSALKRKLTTVKMREQFVNDTHLLDVIRQLYDAKHWTVYALFHYEKKDCPYCGMSATDIEMAGYQRGQEKRTILNQFFLHVSKCKGKKTRE